MPEPSLPARPLAPHYVQPFSEHSVRRCRDAPPLTTPKQRRRWQSLRRRRGGCPVRRDEEALAAHAPPIRREPSATTCSHSPEGYSAPRRALLVVARGSARAPAGLSRHQDERSNERCRSGLSELLRAAWGVGPPPPLRPALERSWPARCEFARPR